MESSRHAEFQAATDARRAGWAWRRYVEAARNAGDGVHEIRYEHLAADHAGTAAALAAFLGGPEDPLIGALAAFSDSSIGRFRRDLTPGQIAEIEDEAGPLLAELGYLH